MTTRMIRNVSCASVLCAACLLLLPACALQGDSSEEVTLDRETLSGKRFQFSWSSDGGGSVNGIALLKEDGSIEGINSPNETTWQIDAAGRLLFKHADGRVSTRYDKVWREDGVLRFEGPFLFREGITHHLIEVGAAPKRENAITAAQAEKIKYSSQSFVYLDIGENCLFRLKDGRQKRICLISVKEHEDPVIHLIRRADVVVEINGEPVELICAPYVMPTEVQGLRIQADTTSAWMDMPKRVQFSLWDASDPIVDTSLFCFPLADYALFSHGMQGYNEPVHWGHRDGDPVGGCFYHNYGVDLAGYEGRQKVLSAIDGVVVGVGHENGDLMIRDDNGYVLYYGHLDAILPDVKEGASVTRGQWVAMLGKRGGSGNFAHLHVGSYLSAGGRLSRNLNLYPWLVAAYQAQSETSLYAVARPHQTALTGDKVFFDGSNSMACDANIVSFKWEFDDGTSLAGPKAEKVFAKPGCYIASLWVTDDRGNRDVDFCKVKVFSRSKPEDVIPILFVTYTPARDVCVDEPVSFRLWPQGLRAENIQVDFGAGAIVRDYRPYSAISHTFTKPGIHVVTVTGTAGGLPVTQKAKVVVEE